MIGGKNGYTVAAQASYVGAATRDGHTIIVALMRDQANFWPEEKALLDWGFAAEATATPVGQLVGPYVYTHRQPGTDQAAGPDRSANRWARVTQPRRRPRRRVENQSTGAAVTSALIWTAVGAAALFFLAAAAQLARRRRLAGETDERYLTGLSGLSRGPTTSRTWVRPRAGSARRQPERELPLGSPHAVVTAFEEPELGDRKLRLVIGQLEKRPVEDLRRHVVGHGDVRVVVELRDCRPAGHGGSRARPARSH